MKVVVEISQNPNAMHLIKFARKGESEIKEYTVQEFQTATGHIYLPALEFESETIHERIKAQCAHALKVGSVGTESRWLGALHTRELKSHSVADVSIRWIDETFGYGLFAEKDLAAGDFIGEYTGVVRKCPLIFATLNPYCFAYPTSALTFKKHMIDAGQKGNEMRYANHSDLPNAESMGVLFEEILHIIIRAIQDIPAHSQITYDYSGFYWLSKKWRPKLTQPFHIEGTEDKKRKSWWRSK